MNSEAAPITERRAARFLERPWVQRTVCSIALLAPGSVAIVLGRQSIRGAIEAGAMVGCVVVVLCMVNSFDTIAKVSLPDFSGIVGNALKLLSLLHGIAAIKIGVEMFQDESTTRFNELPLWAKFVALAWLWGVAAISYIAGDARLRSVNRNT